MFQDGSAGAAGGAAGRRAGRRRRQHVAAGRPAPCRPLAPQPRAAAVASLLTISRTFDSLSRVLFIFPSRYLFAIGLSSLFSLGWGIPPAWSCSPKQLDSTGGPLCAHVPRGCHPLRRAVPGDLDVPCAVRHYNTLAGFQTWTVPGSLAVTAGILVSFFSSAY